MFFDTWLVSRLRIFLWWASLMPLMIMFLRFLNMAMNGRDLESANQRPPVIVQQQNEGFHKNMLHPNSDGKLQVGTGGIFWEASFPWNASWRGCDALRVCLQVCAWMLVSYRSASPRWQPCCPPRWAAVPTCAALWASFVVRLCPDPRLPLAHCGWRTSGL